MGNMTSETKRALCGYLKCLGNCNKAAYERESKRTEEWKKDILCSLGNAGALITEIVPDLEMIIGRQPAVEIPQSKEAINRIMMVFENF